jgi:hypothetical protein
MQLKNKDDRYASTLETIFSNFPIHRIWPSINVTPEQFGMTDNDRPSNLDYFHQIFQNHYSTYYAQIFQRLSKMGVIGFTYEVPPLNMSQESQ